jgi:DNA-binding NarL/FixJ family response regulator
VRSPARVLLADDCAAARAGVRAALEVDDFTVSAEAADAETAIELAFQVRPDVCLVNIDVPGGGIWAAAQITGRSLRTAVVILAASSRDADLLDALRAGAVGYLRIDTDPARLPHALRGVLAGEAAVPRKLVSRLIDELRSQGRRRMAFSERGAAELTSREWQVLSLLHEGLSTADAAQRLFVSPVTVRRHVSTIVRKLDVPDRDAALRLLEDRA